MIKRFNSIEFLLIIKMKQTPNQFSSPKKPITKNQCLDDWARIEELKRKKKTQQTEEQILDNVEKYEELDYSDSSSDSQTELPVERLNSTPKSFKAKGIPGKLAHPAKPGSMKKSKKIISLKPKKFMKSVQLNRPRISMEPFNMKDERDNHFIDSRGNFLYKNYNSHNDAWLLSLDEEVRDPKILKNKKKTYEFAINQKIIRARSEESSLKSADEFITSDSFKEKKIETLKITLLELLETGESANKAIKRFTGSLPGAKKFKPFKKNVRKNQSSKFFKLNNYYEKIFFKFNKNRSNCSKTQISFKIRKKEKNEFKLK